MKNKILVIFFLALIFSVIIYKINVNNKKNILILGDKYYLSSNYKTYDHFLRDKYYNVNILLTDETDTYSKIKEKIINNYSITIKNKKMYLSQEISKANYIIISANNSNYMEKCNKSKKVSYNYIKKINNDINDLINIINKISTSKIIIIDNSCSNNTSDYIHIKLKNIPKNKNSGLSLNENYIIFKKIVDKIEQKN